ncbi:MAG TPA: hypothetical protein VFL57_04785 [Bryobacteraceae bacterium]|nr:hypothetical protein [Bryobacteraceae bacterium]
MAARQSAPVLGALCSRADHPVTRRQPWTLSIGYRFQPSSRHFIGTVEQKQREAAGNQIQNVYHLFDISISRQLTRRWAATASLPILFAYRNQLYVPRGEFRVRSIGDATVGGRAWLLRPPTESGGNIGIGISLKLPTGQYNATGAAIGRAGTLVIATADQSIQAGDGGTGFAIDVQAHRPIPFGTMVYFNGGYLFNPRNTNGVSTFRTRPGEEVMSVADQYLYRGGLSHAVPGVRGLTATFGGRMEGVPVRDLIGRSDGFRRPGYAISIDPGLMYARRSYVFAVNAPIPVERNRKRSLADYRNRTHGDAAFADYAIVVGMSRRF